MQVFFLVHVKPELYKKKAQLNKYIFFTLTFQAEIVIETFWSLFFI